ncbi:trigger factor [Mailhella massiliensis]|uniref:Trigger factor n=1 Tax=Mailhella massiliensis TaxID=1903261 RepID=A0A921AWL4_9BACT|nr:trigger factor [Mailhella massiliensis]HJD97449.1 trigger factor [Mailhella massiliensis]
MEYSIEKTSPTSVSLTVTCSADEVRKAFDRAAKAIGKGMNLPGFRVGKIPVNVIKSRFASRVAADATEILADATMMDILKKEGVRPLCPSQYHGQGAQEGTEFSFSSSFDILPEMELPDLETLSVAVPDPAPGDDALNAMLDQALRRLAGYEEVTDRKPQDHDILTVDVRGTVDGKALPGMTADNFRLHLLPVQPGGKVPEMDPIVRALHVGERGQGVMVCPDNYPDPTLRGREVQLDVVLRRIQREVLPPLTDETAQKLGFKTFDDLKQEVWQQTFAARMRQIQREGKHRLMEEQLSRLDFPLPESLVQRFYREHLRDAEHYLKKQHADADTIRETLEHMHDEAMEFARKKAKGHTFLLALAQREGISVSGKEAEDAVRAMTKGKGQNYDDLRKTIWETGVVTAMQERMIVDRALDRLYGAARKIMAESTILRPFSEVRKDAGG